MTDDPLEGFVPLDRQDLREAAREARAAAEALEAHREALIALTELSGDLSLEAVRRLRERGASAAQVERTEQAYRRAAREAAESLRATEDRLGGLRARLQELADV